MYFFIASRLLLRGKKIQSRVLLSVSGIALGVAVLYVTLGIMDGYRGQLERILRMTFAPYQVILDAPRLDLPSHIEKRVEIREVQYSQGLFLACTASTGQFLSIKASEDEQGLILGSGAARSLGTERGGCVRLVVQSTSGLPRVKTFTVSEIRTFGMTSLDDGWAFLPLAGMEGLTTRKTFEIYPVKGLGDPQLLQDIRAHLPREASLITLEEANRDLFGTLKFQEWIMAVVLGLITAVAGLFLLARLLMDTEERRKTVGILRALGFTTRQVTGVFFIYGLVVGIFGILFGLFLGASLGILINATPILHFTGALSEVYGVDSIPISPTWIHILGIALYAGIIVTVASLLPALRARRVPVLTAIRYE
ncbi:MAG TPA: FtsX-like permease family protein [Thermoanaerobaculia bacterium]|nr:FtsX-like permease family protein [Thermoanaerobaculia bacterium]HUM30505.1 FtsX-like permease family protein [Thermoanaerobaculia bacterium]HXK68628.1 FtsX-like permease family protein [Thermoanaerobaculia bacterium]